MSPHFHFRLTREGYDRCIDLLAAAGMTFTEVGRESFGGRPGKPMHEIRGRPSSSKGIVRCALRDCMGSSFSFTVTITEFSALEILEAVERALTNVRIPD